jgi:hypothetical protein
VLNIGVIGE